MRYRGDYSLALLFSLGQTNFGRLVEDFLLDPGGKLDKFFAEYEGDDVDAGAGEAVAYSARQTLALIERGEIVCTTPGATVCLQGLLRTVALSQCRAPTMKNEILAQRAIRAKPSTTGGPNDES